MANDIRPIGQIVSAGAAPSSLAGRRLILVAAVPSTVRAFLQDRLRALRDMGCQVTVAASPATDLDVLAQAGFACVPIEIPRAIRPLKLLRAGWKLLQLFRRSRADIVHTHTPIAAFLGQAAARMAGVRMRVNTVHGLFFVNVHRPPLRWLYRSLEIAACRLATQVICDSAEDVRYLCAIHKFPSKKVTAINVGVNLDAISPAAAGTTARRDIRSEFNIPPDAFVFGTIARMVREKGLVELFEAFDALAARHGNVYLLHVGPEDNSRKDGIARSELMRGPAADRCKFAGQRYDIARVLAAMDVFVLPSHREGFPVSIMEAAAMGLPSITTDIRGCRESVVEGATGLIVPPRDPKALEAAMEKLLLDPSLRRQMGEAALLHARKHFDRRMVVQRTVDLYEGELVRREQHRCPV